MFRDFGYNILLFSEKNKDKIILSKGHSAIAQYAILDYLKILLKKTQPILSR